MVKLTAGSASWTGVFIESRGVILTTSRDLGTAPLVSFRTAGGSTGEAWVFGRDDGLGLALLEVTNPGQEFTVAPLHSGNPPERSDELAMLRFVSTSTSLDKRNTQVVGSRQDLSGIDYLQLQALAAEGSQGGAIVDASGTLRALRMVDQHMVDLGIARAGETWAINSAALTLLVIPQLETGVTNIDATAGECTGIGAPPPVPAIYKGDGTVGGVELAVGQRVYARVASSGRELWFSEEVVNPGRYFLTISICDTSFVGGVVDFWVDARRAPLTSLYEPVRIFAVDLDF